LGVEELSETPAAFWVYGASIACVENRKTVRTSLVDRFFTWIQKKATNRWPL